jgi:hypothetical protein
MLLRKFWYNLLSFTPIFVISNYDRLIAATPQRARRGEVSEETLFN